jgi:23S rRNA (adenine2503-C2)-methyltransferase
MEEEIVIKEKVHPYPLCNFTENELAGILAKAGFEKFRAKQIFNSMYKNLTDPTSDANTTLPKPLKKFLKENFIFTKLILHTTYRSCDGTRKFAFKLNDATFIESVLIPQKGKEDTFTLCISTQVGCPVKCIFCASGKKGLLRNLQTFEIVEQVISILKYLHTSISHPKKRKIQNIVVMGMGEPLLNFDNLSRALKILTNPNGLRWGWHKITLSTIGIKNKIKKMIEANITPNLAISLHAPNDTLRHTLIPYKAIMPINELLNEAIFYKKQTKKEVTIEYVMLQDINDTPQCAYELAALLKHKPFKVNLIPYNPIEDSTLKPSLLKTIERFSSILKSHSITTTVRQNMGQDISSACGQLALKIHDNHFI